VADAATLDAFREAVDDDFDAAGGLAVVFDAVREGNRLLDSGQDASGLAAAVAEIVGVLGLAPDAPEIDDLEAALGALGERFGVSGSDPAGMVDALVTHRTESRDARDWATADAVRDALAEIGIVVEDGPDGSRWHRG
jgi:cysteinyl-tRNA synthetase